MDHFSFPRLHSDVTPLFWCPTCLDFYSKCSKKLTSMPGQIFGQTPTKCFGGRANEKSPKFVALPHLQRTISRLYVAHAGRIPRKPRNGREAHRQREFGRRKCGRIGFERGRSANWLDRMDVGGSACNRCLIWLGLKGAVFQSRVPFRRMSQLEKRHFSTVEKEGGLVQRHFLEIRNRMVDEVLFSRELFSLKTGVI